MLCCAAGTLLRAFLQAQHFRSRFSSLFRRFWGLCWHHVGTQDAPKSTNISEKCSSKTIFFFKLQPKLTAPNTPKSVFESRNPKVKCISGFSREASFFLIFGANMNPCWRPRSMKIWAKRSSRRCRKSIAVCDLFSYDLGAILAAYLVTSWRPGHSQTAPKSAQEPAKTVSNRIPGAPGTQFFGFW